MELGDGSRVTYCWYRFVDQPSFQQYTRPPYTWSEEKREALQSFVEELHRQWPGDPRGLSHEPVDLPRRSPRGAIQGRSR